MRKERFENGKDLQLFTGAIEPIQQEYYPLWTEGNRKSSLVLSDTAMHPEGWRNCSFEISYSAFERGGTLLIAFGKKYANEAEYKSCIRITEDSIAICWGKEERRIQACLQEEGLLKVRINEYELQVQNGEDEVQEKLSGELLNGYMELSFQGNLFHLNGFMIDSELAPYTQVEHQKKLLQWRQRKLDETDQFLENIAVQTQQARKTNPVPKNVLDIPYRMVDVGEKMTVKIRSEEDDNVAIVVTHNCMKMGVQPLSIPLDLHYVTDAYEAEFEILLDTPGNTKIEVWFKNDYMVRQIAVLDKGYLAVIPWIGLNKPDIDTELHKYDIPGDFWLNVGYQSLRLHQEKLKLFLKNQHRYGDRIVPVMEGNCLIPESETKNLSELDTETKRRGIAQFLRLWEILGFEKTELVGSYTADTEAINIMEEFGIKGLTSLCVWQNWQDGGWKINHCGLPSQPYYPAQENFRKNGPRRKLMCYTMGNSSCTRNYSIMTMESCPSLVVPNERYFENRVQHFQVQRFYDAFDGYIRDAGRAEGTMIATVSLENFTGNCDWHAVNDLAIRYMIQRAGTEKIVFVSAADVTDYHNRKNIPMQKVIYLQPDIYYGYHSCELPGNVPDRIEVEHPEYLAVLKRGSSLPVYFFDYSTPWGEPPKEEKAKNLFGLVNPDNMDTTEYYPPQVERKDIQIDCSLEKEKVLLKIYSESDKKRVVTAVFDIPLEKDFICETQRNHVYIEKVTDFRTGNSHLVVEIEDIKKGQEEIQIRLDGQERIPHQTELEKDGFGIKWYGDHAYMRSLNRERAIGIRIAAPAGAYWIGQDGIRHTTKDGKLELRINEGWYNEAPILYGYDMDAFAQALPAAQVLDLGVSQSRVWPWEVK